VFYQPTKEGEAMPTLSDYELDLNDIQEDPKGAIAKVLDAFKSAAKKYRASTETVSTGVKQAVSTVQENEVTVINHENLIDNLRSTSLR
jgi:hypothetical protein